MSDRERLDVLLVERGLVASREAARRLIMAGEVRVDGEVRTKPGMRVARAVVITVQQTPRFVSRGGEKLAAALEAFPVAVGGRVCADVGASTGGFTDCLLQHGAAKVYAIDVGYGQLAFNLRQDQRVVPLERTNARYLERLPEPVSLVVVDASFISLRLLLPTIAGWLAASAIIVPLIKPQFEAGREDVGRGGVVRDRAVHARVIHEVFSAAEMLGFHPRGIIRSPLLGPAGNTEFLGLLTWGRTDEPIDWKRLIADLIGQ
jgi:23S rRNA (cytidine1920-2'-O)/16S rRNA (cytidine1409-2'-O)-methyltransferase